MKSKILGVALAWLLGACTSSSDSIRLVGQDGPFRLGLDEVVRVAVGTEPPTLDWHKATDTTSSLVIVNLMEGLTAFDVESEGAPLVPGLAESWTHSEDFLEWTFRLRDNVTWSDGVPFVAQHLVDGWRRLLEPETASEYAYFLFSVENSQAYNSGEIKDFSEVGVEALDEHTLRVRLNKGISYFPYLLAHGSTYPIRLDVVEKHGGLWTEARNLVGLGPYTLKEWRHDDYILLESNPKYFRGEPRTKYVLGRIVERSATAVRLYTTGQLDVLMDLPLGDLRRLKKMPGYDTSPNLLMMYYGFNVRKPPLDNRHLRRALVLAIDKSQIATALGGGQEPLPCWLPKGLLGYSEDVGLPFDVERARQELRKAGYKSGVEVPKIVLGFNTNESHRIVAENVQQQLSKNLGVSIEVTNEEWKTYLNTLNSDPYPIYRLGWMADYPDPDNFLNLMTSYSLNNRGGWANDGFDGLIKKGAMELDPSKREDIYLKAQRVLCEEDAAVMPLYIGVAHFLINSRVKKFPRNNLGYYRFYGMEIL